MFKLVADGEAIIDGFIIKDVISESVKWISEILCCDQELECLNCNSLAEQNSILFDLFYSLLLTTSSEPHLWARIYSFISLTYIY